MTTIVELCGHTAADHWAKSQTARLLLFKNYLINSPVISMITASFGVFASQYRQFIYPSSLNPLFPSQVSFP